MSDGMDPAPAGREAILGVFANKLDLSADLKADMGENLAEVADAILAALQAEAG